jgi:D-beta-D-heptose 7-phosphate kinase/D-beta-D-heptose 1-phosphate adenosyltransferase
MKIVLVTGGFDPIHSGHIAYFNEAKELGDILIVGVNSDEWLTHKKGQPFMSLSERVAIVESLHMVDSVMIFDDSDGGASEAIKLCLGKFPNDEIIFANGGDRTNSNIPEMSIKDERLSFVFGVGGTHKMNSSSKILTEWKTPKTERKWGYYRVLHSDGPSTKVKELVVEPGKSLSLQRHKYRNELWYVTNGIGAILHNGIRKPLKKGDFVTIVATDWHQLINDSYEELKIVEIQYGENCYEEDIERIE